MNQQPYQQVPPAPTTGQWGASTVLSNLGAEVISGIAYLLSLLSFLGFILQIVLFATEKNRFAKFHAAQAMLLGVASVVLTIVYFVLTGVTGAGLGSVNSGAANAAAGGMVLLFTCVFGLLSLAIFGFWIWGMVAAFTGKATKLPIIGSIAEGLAGGPVAGV